MDKIADDISDNIEAASVDCNFIDRSISLLSMVKVIEQWRDFLA